jgi:hypothetical protein
MILQILLRALTPFQVLHLRTHLLIGDMVVMGIPQYRCQQKQQIHIVLG